MLHEFYTQNSKAMEFSRMFQDYYCRYMSTVSCYLLFKPSYIVLIWFVIQVSFSMYRLGSAEIFSIYEKEALYARFSDGVVVIGVKPTSNSY